MATRDPNIERIRPTKKHETVVCPNCDGWTFNEDRMHGRYESGEWESPMKACKPCNGRGVMVKVTEVSYRPLGGPEPAEAAAPVPRGTPWPTNVQQFYPATLMDPIAFPPVASLVPPAPGSVQLLAA